MNNSKTERSAFTQSFGEAIFLLPLGIFICMSLVGVHALSAGFWTELLTGFSVTGVSLVIANRSSVYNSKTDSEITFRNLLLVSIGGALVSALTNIHNPNQNSFGPVLWITCIALAVLLIVWLFNGDFSDSSDNNFRYYKNGKYVYHSGFSKLLSIFTIIALAAELYIHFGTQFIWIPAIVLSVFLGIFFEDPRIKYFMKWNGEWFKHLIVAPVTIAVVSTFSQFWFSQIAFGYTLWQVFIGLGVVLVMIGVIVLCYKEAEEKREDKAQKAEQAKREDQRVKDNADRFALVQLALIAIKEEKQALWSEILCVARYYNQEIHRFTEILPKIHLAPLEQTVSISTIKKQIVWTGDYQVALQILEKLAVKSYSDEQLKLLITQLSDFIAILEQHKDFAGYNEAMREIKTRCTTLFNMLPKQ